MYLCNVGTPRYDAQIRHQQRAHRQKKETSFILSMRLCNCHEIAHLRFVLLYLFQSVSLSTYKSFPFALSALCLYLCFYSHTYSPHIHHYFTISLLLQHTQWNVLFEYICDTTIFKSSIYTISKAERMHSSAKHEQTNEETAGRTYALTHFK